MGHIGITVGIFALIRKHPLFSNIPIDLKIVALGSMLPDFIDKPMGQVLLADSIGNGRMLAHTLLFCLLLLSAGLYVHTNSQYTGIIIISAASFLHLLEDSLWTTPETFFWPLPGLEFANNTPQIGFTDFFIDVFIISYTPALNQVFISEIAGLICLIGIMVDKKISQAIRSITQLISKHINNLFI